MVAAPIVPDLTCVSFQYAGSIKRSASQHPSATPAKMKYLTTRVRELMEKMFEPLDGSTTISVLDWINNTTYPTWKKEDLMKKWNNKENLIANPKWSDVNSFIKDESYPEFKYPRPIQSRSDYIKPHFGMWFKAIEEKVYSNPYFIKHVPVDQRPQYIMDHVYNPNASVYFATDYTAFESQFVKELMLNVEIQFYKYMTQYVPGHEGFWWLCDNVLAGVNNCHFNSFDFQIEATRMSGEMCTSLGNGFSNLMFFLIIAESTGCENIRGVVEGDDGLFSMKIPPGARVPTKEDFAEYGLTIKIDEHEKIETASFCGIIFDSEEKINIRDPIGMILDTGFGYGKLCNAKQSKKLSLLRCKAMSMKSQYKGCPLLDAYASYILRCTRNIDHRSMMKQEMNNYWKRELWALNKWTNFEPVTPGVRTRILMAQKFGISIQQQIIIENYFNSLTSIVPIDHPELNSLFPEQNKWMSDTFVRSFDQNSALEPMKPDFDFGFPIPKIKKVVRPLVPKNLVNHFCQQEVVLDHKTGKFAYV